MKAFKKFVRYMRAHRTYRRLSTVCPTASSVAACLLLTCLLPGCSGGESSSQGANAAPVHVAPVSRASLDRMVHAVGNVTASASVAIEPRVTGEIIDVTFREGDEVAPGQPLLRIDPRPYEAALREKRGNLARSRAQLAKARDDQRRYQRLARNDYVSKEAYQQTATEAAALAAAVESDLAAVERAALDLEYCTVQAPIGGRIGALKVHKGNQVKSGSDPIVDIDAIAPCYVEFALPEGNLPAVVDLMAAGEITLTATPTGGAGETGRLMLLDNKVDTKTGTIRLRGVFDNGSRHLWPGQFVDVEIPLGRYENVLTVPSAAVQTGREESYVYVATPDNQADYRKVDVLFQKDGLSVLEGELAPGEKVVVEGQVRLAPGSRVKILDS